MKTNKLTFPLMLALAATLATTGCHNHRPVKITGLPGNQAPQIGEFGSGGTMGGDTGVGVNTKPGGGEQASIDQFEGMDKDPATLQADTIHFSFDSAAIRKTEQANLQAVASYLSQNPETKLLIEGNCDERGTEEYNRSLGERRALAAREALAKMGVSPDRVRTISYGKDKPANPGHDDAAWAQNRRDDFVVLRPHAGA